MSRSTSLRTHAIILLAIAVTAARAPSQAPSVTGVTRLLGDPICIPEAPFLVTFDQPVLGVDATDLALVTSLPNLSIAGVEGNTGLDFQINSQRLRVPALVGAPSTALTIEFWVRTTDPAGAFLHYTVPGTDDELRLGNPSNLTLEIADIPIPSSGIDIVDGAWHHVAVTWESATGDALFYVDGALASSQNGVQTAMINPGGDLVLTADGGGSGTNWSAPLQAALDDVRLWSVARSASEIQTSLSGTITGQEAGLVACWKLDEYEDFGLLAAGLNDVRDASPNGNHGAVENGPVPLVAAPTPDWTVRVSFAATTGSGTAGIEVLNDSSIVSTAGVPLAAPFSGGEVYTYGVPLGTIAVTSVAPSSGFIGGGDTVVSPGNSKDRQRNGFRPSNRRRYSPTRLASTAFRRHAPAMLNILSHLTALLHALACDRARLAAENVLLRQQLALLGGA